MRTEFYEDALKEWRWVMTDADGKLIGACIEGFKRREDCVKNYRMVKGEKPHPLLEAAFLFTIISGVIAMIAHFADRC